jgi:PAS domain S-box-containing protein
MARSGNGKARQGQFAGGRGAAPGVNVGSFPPNSPERAQLWARQQQALASLGQAALTSADVDTLLSEASCRLAETLGVDLVAAYILEPDGQSLALRAGVGWKPGYVGRARVGTQNESPAGFAVLAGEPVVVEDWGRERRFAMPPLLREHAVVSGVVAPIPGQPRAYGVLAVHTLARREFSVDEVLFVRAVANVLAAALRHEQSVRALRDGEARLRALVDSAVEGIITIDERGVVESMNPAACRLFGYACDEVAARNVSMLMPEPYRSRHDDYMQAYLRTGQARIIGIGREVIGLRKDGTTFPLYLSVSEFFVSGKRMFTGVVRDISDRRRLEREVLEVGSQEQRRIGQDLHDGLCQHLTGVAFALEVLGNKLGARAAPETPGIRKIAELVDQAISQARELARGLQPVMLEAVGLVAALKELSEKVEGLFRISCLFVCDGPVLVHDNAVATHLYRITQEAISNAVKHGKARTVVIDLTADRGELRLKVTDDGVGLGNARSDGKGIGMKTMAYRARLIGGTFDVVAGPAGGTMVVCTVPLIGVGETEAVERADEHESQKELGKSEVIIKEKRGRRVAGQPRGTRGGNAARGARGREEKGVRRR